MIVQDAVNGDVGGGVAAIQVTSGLYHIWRAQGFTSTAQLFVTGMSALGMALLWSMDWRLLSVALIFDCNLRAHPVIAQVMSHKNTIVVHLNWICILLVFHSFGLYIHNDTVAALGRSYD